MQATKAESYMCHPAIFREYDIRGVYQETLSETDAYYIGRAFGTHIIRAAKQENPSIAVGRDGRLSSPALTKALIEGIIESGVSVRDIGVGPTPMLYFSVYSEKLAGGVMVTGSHNPPTHNGFKFSVGSRPFFGKDIAGLGELIAKRDFESGKGQVSEHDVRHTYLDALVAVFDKVPGLPPKKVAWDAGNGAAGEMMAKLCASIPGEHIILNDEIDGTFPAHHPDPTVPENLEQLIQVVKDEQCDFGVAFDGDGDRLGVVDGKGRIIWGDQLVLLLARSILQAHPDSTIIADVKASQVLFDGIKEAGGDPLMWKTGHSLIKAKMLETGSLFAGEMSGHLFFSDEYYGYDDGLYAAVRVLRMAMEEKQSITEMLDELPVLHSTPEIRVECPDDKKFGVIEAVANALESSEAHVSEVDGVRVTNDDGWWLLRASNTQPALVVRCEAYSEEGLVRLKQTLQEQLDRHEVKLP